MLGEMILLASCSSGDRYTGFCFSVALRVRFSSYDFFEGDGSEIYISCIAFRDLVDEDIAEAYGIPLNLYAGKCISLVSRVLSFSVLRDALKEIFDICFFRGSRSVVAARVSNVPLPTPGIDRVLFTIDNCLLSAEAPPKDGLLMLTYEIVKL
ncbi:hypothetical protein Cgig2_025260 [Carnegiea gigantea]|uniref:Uncharacterized protein n=1 Tax=Carnegiea gigantea TaxID=171969 RepID=A0A9Q1JPG6_9CARY|nr:hypothetical protein Cgig2_025260 [Carnegiea gigantea]